MSHINKIALLTLIFLGSVSCKVNTEVEKSVFNPPPSQESSYETSFFLSTQENLLDKFEIIKQVNLYEYIPDLNELPIEYDSFAQVYNVLKEDAQALNANRAVLKKDENCVAQIGYCEAYFIKVIKN